MTNPRRSHSSKHLISVVILCLAVGSFASLAPPARAQQVNVVERRNAKDYHVVQEGDTLYDLSGQYMRDVYNWPRLWSYNPHITNPHWIYPSDIVYLKPAQMIDEQPQSTGPQRVTSGGYKPTELHIAVAGFVENDEVKYVGRVVASPKQAVMISEWDDVWVGFGDEAYTSEELDTIPDDDRYTMADSGEVQIGDKYAIVRTSGHIRDEDENILGHKYEMVGALEITETSEKYLETARVVQSWLPIERGDLLIRYEQQQKMVSPIQADQDMVATIVDLIEPRSALGEFHYVYVDRGADDGVRQGNRFFVFQKQEGLSKESNPTESEIPWSRIGQVLLLDVRKSYSLGIVLDSNREIFTGDRLEMYQGY